MKKWMWKGWLGLGLSLLPGLAQALPNEIMQEGILIDAGGNPIEGAHSIRVRIWTDAAAGMAVSDETFPNVQLVEGYYFVAVGSQRALTAGMFTGGAYLGISVDNGPELAPRLALRKVPAAFVADNVVGDITPHTVAVGGNVVIDAQGRWVGAAAGLQGPAGPAGPIGPQGPVGPQGAAGGAGQNADPAAVVPLLVANLAANPNQLPYVRNDVAATKSGNLTMNAANIILSGGVLQIPAGAARTSIAMGDTDLGGANSIHLNDPGPTEGIFFDGTQASIIVSPGNGADQDGMLRLRNDDLISLETNAQVTGNLNVGANLTVATGLNVPSITTTTLTATNGTVTNGTITNLNGPGNRIVVNGNLQLNGDVSLSAATDFIGDLRTSNIVTSGNQSATGNVSAGQNVTAAGSVIAGGNVQAGVAGSLRAGTGGLYINNTQIFDGNGNQLRTPALTCPAGQVMMGTTNNALARCVSVTCPAGAAVRGYNADGSPICETDDVGLAALPANACAAGQALVSIAANGATVCAAVGGGGGGNGRDQLCGVGRKMVGLAANGSITCDCNQDGQCPANQYCNVGAQYCQNGCRNDGACPANQYCDLANHACVNGCRDNASCPANQSCVNHGCVAGVRITADGEAYGHHGACSGWNRCGNAQTCALWACNVRGFPRLISFGRNGPCTGFRVCHLFHNGCCGGIQWNWGNRCGVAGVSEITCGR